jgi:hypothetical protein
MLDETVWAIVEELNKKFTDFEFTAPHLINFEGFVAVNITRVSFRKARGPWIKLCNLWVSGGDLKERVGTCCALVAIDGLIVCGFGFVSGFDLKERVGTRCALVAIDGLIKYAGFSIAF